MAHDVTKPSPTRGFPLARSFLVIDLVSLVLILVLHVGTFFPMDCSWLLAHVPLLFLALLVTITPAVYFSSKMARGEWGGFGRSIRKYAPWWLNRLCLVAFLYMGCNHFYGAYRLDKSLEDRVNREGRVAEHDGYVATYKVRIFTGHALAFLGLALTTLVAWERMCKEEQTRLQSCSASVPGMKTGMS